MPKPKWNDEQLAAIGHRGSHLLVAAGAGSGKTAVLVERLLRLLLDPTEPMDLDRFLIVTFTRAAASEMRAKIAKALTEQAAANPRDRRLRRQLSLLPRAQITTVDSFCVALIREHFQNCGISPDFRVADEAECAVLRRQALVPLVEDAYASGDPGFLLLADTVSQGRSDDKLLDVIDTAHQQMSAHPDPAEWAAEMSGEDTGVGPYAERVIFDAALAMDSLIRRYEGLIPLLRGISGNEPMAETLEIDEEACRAICAVLHSGDWDRICEAFSGFRAVRAKSVAAAAKGAAFEAAAKLRKDAKTKIGKYAERYFAVSLDEARAAEETTLPVRRALMHIVTEFDAAYSALKTRRNVIDFSDAEHLALRLLAQKTADGYVPTAVAEGMRFAEIMVDEYQDTNGVQDAIFGALAGSSGRLFMVGDMKQSIYRFRMADPSIFLRKYLAYADEPGEGQPRRIILSRNYRSRSEILDGVNAVFSRIMTQSLGEMDYTEREYLRPGASYPALPEPVLPELAVIGKTDELPDCAANEAEYVARELRRMMDSGCPVTENGVLRPMRWSDAAILMRSTASGAARFRRALERYGIPVAYGVADSLYDSTEVRSVCDLLSCIDNPRQDVALAAVMRMPFLPFTADEMTVIRLRQKKCPFWQAVFTAAEQAGTPSGDALYDSAAQKCAGLLDILSHLREDAIDQPLDRFFRTMMDRLGLLGLYGAMSNGEQRQQNLLALFGQAASFEQSGYRGLYRFVTFLRRQAASGKESHAPMAETSADAVHLMSIHRSKGLEFPIVFLSCCGKKFNMTDLRQAVLLHKDLGAGLYCRDRKRNLEYPTISRSAIEITVRRELLSEEMRVLYVGMTRAKERLVLTAGNDLAAGKLYTDDDLGSLSDRISYLEWMLPALGDSHPEWAFSVRAPEEPAETGPDSRSCADEAPDPALADSLRKAIFFEYPFKESTVRPSKLTATAFRREAADARRETAEEAASIPAATPSGIALPDARAVPATRPAFIVNRDLTALTPAQKGTALHLAMQYIDYRAASVPDGAAAEIARLQNEQYLTPPQAAAVDPRHITRFFRSPLGTEILSSPLVRREFKFSLLADASLPEHPDRMPDETGPGTEQLLLQGVIDCFFLTQTPDGPAWTIVDYKTDRIPEGGEQEAAERYAPQLRIYAYALRRITGLPVARCLLYLFSTGNTVSVPVI